MKTIIIIPVRMAATRFPNKPMALIDNKPMVMHVWEQAKKSNIGRVIVACCEKEVESCILSAGGEAILTDPALSSGTDRIYEVIKNDDDFILADSIINLQGDMPLIRAENIQNVNEPIIQGYDISTLVTNFSSQLEKNNNNITKAKVKWIKKEKMGEAVDFNKDISQFKNVDVYHHVGIYGFTSNALKKFVSLSRSKREIELSLEQMRALDNNMTIGISYVENIPISVDTKEDLEKVEQIIKKKYAK